MSSRKGVAALRSEDATTVASAGGAHVPLLMGLLFRRVREAQSGGEWEGMRQSHFRVVSSVPRDGVTITALAERLEMTKQGCGQFVTALTDSGHLRVDTGPTDRRVRLVTRTPLGDALVARLTDYYRDLEAQWAEQVGPRRYRTFRLVLEELVLSDPHLDPEPDPDPDPGHGPADPTSGATVRS